MAYDVIVIGAGPAGLFASYELTKKNKNLKILLIFHILVIHLARVVGMNFIYYLDHIDFRSGEHKEVHITIDVVEKVVILKE